jgi:hypothetical protein
MKELSTASHLPGTRVNNAPCCYIAATRVA